MNDAGISIETRKNRLRQCLLPIASEFSEVEKTFAQLLESNVEVLAQAGGHLRKAGGKRLRPAMLLLAAKAVPAGVGNLFPRETLIRAACAMEALHLATLVHDDVVDVSPERRGRETANAIWGNEVSVLAGDFILSKALSVLSEETDLWTVQRFTRLMVDLCEGEVGQLVARGNHSVTESMYFANVDRKTASVFAACCEIGAYLGGGDEGFRRHLGEFGLHFGRSFQIRDDLLDLIGNPSVTGKPIGNDLREKSFTLPIIRALTYLQTKERGELTKLLDEFDQYEAAEMSFERTQRVARICERVGAIRASQETAQKEMEMSLWALGNLPRSEASEALKTIAIQMLEREF